MAENTQLSQVQIMARLKVLQGAVNGTLACFVETGLVVSKAQ